MKKFNYAIDLFDKEEIATGEIKAQDIDEARDIIMENLEKNIGIVETK